MFDCRNNQVVYNILQVSMWLSIDTGKPIFPGSSVVMVRNAVMILTGLLSEKAKGL